jgi:glycosyltransferase involved in cell wall biosynthesis
MLSTQVAVPSHDSKVRMPEDTTSGARRPMRILEVETFGRGGLIHYAYNLSCALAERGHDVTLVTAAAYELEGRALPSRVRVLKAIARLTHRLRASWPARALGWAVKPEALADACGVAILARRLRPDVVHLHCTNQIGLVYLILLRLTGLPVAVTAHVVTAHERTRVQDAVHRCIHRLSPLVIAHSAYDRRRLIEEFAVDPGRVRVIAHGEYGFFGLGAEPVEREAARRQLGLDPRDEVALFFGYIREYKGLDVLLDAWPAVAEARPGARLVVAGDPVRLDAARRDALLAAATRVGAIHRFGYVPFSSVTTYFAAADVLVLPYRHISQSGVLFLALSQGLPVVATRVGALPEVLCDGESGLLVPPESPEALSQALVRLFGDADLRRRLSAGSRAVAARHTWPSIAGQTESAFAGLVAGAPRTAGQRDRN